MDDHQNIVKLKLLNKSFHDLICTFSRCSRHNHFKLERGASTNNPT